MISHGYLIHLYCDKCDGINRISGGQGEYAGESKADCLRQARSKGWTITPALTYCQCPQCHKKGKKAEEKDNG